MIVFRANCVRLAATSGTDLIFSSFLAFPLRHRSYQDFVFQYLCKYTYHIPYIILILFFLVYFRLVNSVRYYIPWSSRELTATPFSVSIFNLVGLMPIAGMAATKKRTHSRSKAIFILIPYVCNNIRI